MTKEFFKKKIDKYTKKISLLKGGGRNNYTPAFLVTDMENIDIVSAIDTLKDDNPIDFTLKVPLFLLLSLFVNVTILRPQHEKFLAFMNSYNTIEICDLSNMIHEQMIKEPLKSKREILHIIIESFIKDHQQIYDFNLKAKTEIPILEQQIDSDKNYLESNISTYNSEKKKVDDELKSGSVLKFLQTSYSTIITKYENKRINCTKKCQQLETMKGTIENKLTIFCCQNIPELIPKLNDLQRLKQGLPYCNNILFFNTEISASRKTGAYDDYIFWLLTIAVYNYYNYDGIRKNIICRTNDLQKWYDFNNDCKPKNLYLEMKDIVYNDITKVLKINTNNELNMNKLLNFILYLMKDDEEHTVNFSDVATKYKIDLPKCTTKDNKITLLPSPDGRVLSFIDGDYFIRYCLDINKENFNIIQLYNFKEKILQKNRARRISQFDIMILYIKFIQSKITYNKKS